MRKTLTEAVKFAEENGVFETIENQPRFATLLSLVIAQGPRSFASGRKLRQKLWDTMKCKTFSAQDFKTKVADNTLLFSKCEPIAARRSTIMRITENFLSGNESIEDIKGIGQWTQKAYEIMCGKMSTIALQEDSYIRKQMRGLITWSWIGENMPGWETRLSRLFWRLNDRGKARLHADQPLSRAHFL